jgi:hypothetical protein
MVTRHEVDGSDTLMLCSTSLESCCSSLFNGETILESIHLGDVEFTRRGVNCDSDGIFESDARESPENLVVDGDEIVVATNDGWVKVVFGAHRKKVFAQHHEAKII